MPNTSEISPVGLALSCTTPFGRAGSSDPRVGSEAGFGGVILHGLSTFGFAARAILNAIGGGKPSALRYFGVRFTAPVMPGDELETRAWAVNSGSDGIVEVAFEVLNVTTEKVRLICLPAWVRRLF